MTTPTKPTAPSREWKAVPYPKQEGMSGYRYITDGAYNIASEVTAPDAALIVHAVNSHDALVEALKWYSTHEDNGERARATLAKVQEAGE